MEKEVRLKSDYNKLEQLKEHLNSYSSFDTTIDYDHWDLRTNAQGEMERCIVIKKSNMHGAKAYFSAENTLKVTYIIPNKMMNAYFGKSQKARRNILEILSGAIKNTLLANSQKKAFETIIKTFDNVKA